jgi:hypothetical protein
MSREFLSLTTENKQPLLENIEYSDEFDADAEEESESHCLQHFFAGSVALGCEAGNIPNAYFNLILTIQTLALAFVEINQDDSLSIEAKTTCYILAGHFAFHTLINDLLLIIPAEIYQAIYEKMTLKTTSGAQLTRWQQVSKFFRRIFLTIIYFSFSILSAGGAIGSVEIFFLPVLKQTLGIIAAALGTLFGINYAHFYYTDSIIEAIEFFESCIKHPLSSLKTICLNPGPSLQIAKSFTIVSFYYSTMGVFLSTRFTETLCETFDQPVDKNALISVMKMTAGFMMITNCFTRFLPIKKNYLSSIVTEVTENKLDSDSNGTRFFWKALVDISLESFIAGAMVIFSKNYFNKITIGIIAGGISLIASLTGKEPTLNRQTSFSKLSTWINFNARLHKSTILLMIAIYRLQNMFRDYAGVDLNLNSYDIVCLGVIVGISIAKNRFEVDNNKLDKHISYLKKKREFNRFGVWTIFKPAASFPSHEREQLLQILKR